LKDNIVFKGRVSQEEVAMYMAESISLILSSRYEAFGLVLAEAMATGTPVIASRVGGIPHVVEDMKTGILVEPSDEQALAEKMMLILKDEDLRERLGRSGREVALRRFHPNVVARKTMKVYEEVISSRQG
jgi:glycosyltransferase involved in cell wall biosynthesis